MKKYLSGHFVTIEINENALTSNRWLQNKGRILQEGSHLLNPAEELLACVPKKALLLLQLSRVTSGEGVNFDVVCPVLFGYFIDKAFRRMPEQEALREVKLVAKNIESPVRRVVTEITRSIFRRFHADDLYAGNYLGIVGNLIFKEATNRFCASGYCIYGIGIQSIEAEPAYQDAFLSTHHTRLVAMGYAQAMAIYAQANPNGLPALTQIAYAETALRHGFPNVVIPGLTIPSNQVPSARETMKHIPNAKDF